MATQSPIFDPTFNPALRAEDGQPVPSAGVARRALAAAGWGWFPALSLLYGVALVGVAFAYRASLQGSDLALPLFWFSLIAIFAPTAYRLTRANIAREERIALLVAVGIALYVVKALHSADGFLFHDEFLHWRTANDLLLSGRLFTPNPVLVVSPLYPGLEIVATAFAHLTGVGIVEAGLITLGVARIAFVLALYLMYEQVARSPQIGGLAALLYMGNSNFLFFGAQFSYESLSLPLATALFALLVLHGVWKKRGEGQARAQIARLPRLLLLAVPLILTIAITHHLTAYVLIGVFALWAVLSLMLEGRAWRWLPVGVVALIALVAVLVWSSFTGGTTREYLGPVLRGGVDEFVGFVLAEESGRQLFQGTTGAVSPLWERAVGALSIVIILTLLAFGAWQIWRSPFGEAARARGIRRLRAPSLQSYFHGGANPLAWAFTLLIFIYPVMLGFRFTSSGWEIANRSNEFLFWALSFVMSVGVLALNGFRFRRLHITPHVWAFGFTVAATIIFLGGTISGWPPWARMPGTYLVSADMRSVEPEGITAATWAGAHLDTTERIAADRTNTLLLAAHTRFLPITHQYDDVYIASVFLQPEIGGYERLLIDETALRYALVDARLSTDLPRVGVYFEAGEPNGNRYSTPPALADLMKFDDLAGVSRVFDSGNIRVFDIEGLR